jgi:hypothetical protein
MTGEHSSELNADGSGGATALAAPKEKFGPGQVTRHRWMLVIASRLI